MSLCAEFLSFRLFFLFLIAWHSRYATEHCKKKKEAESRQKTFVAQRNVLVSAHFWCAPPPFFFFWSSAEFFFVYLFSFLLLIVISLRRTLFCRQLSYSLHCFSAFRRLPLLIAFIYSLLRAFICFGLLSLFFFFVLFFSSWAFTLRSVSRRASGQLLQSCFTLQFYYERASAFFYLSFFSLFVSLFFFLKSLALYVMKKNGLSIRVCGAH